MSDSVCETLVQRRKIAGICALFTHQRTGLAIYRGQVEGPCFLSRDDHDHKIRARKQRTDIVKYCFVKRTNCGINSLVSHIFLERGIGK